MVNIQNRSRRSTSCGDVLPAREDFLLCRRRKGLRDAVNAISRHLSCRTVAKFDPHGTGSVALVARYVVIVLISARLPGPFVSVNANLHTAPRWWFKDLQPFHFLLLILFIFYSSPHVHKYRSLPMIQSIMCSNENSWPRRNPWQAIVARLVYIGIHYETGSIL